MAATTEQTGCQGGKRLVSIMIASVELGTLKQGTKPIFEAQQGRQEANLIPSSSTNKPLKT
jgi:hypothetical protein